MTEPRDKLTSDERDALSEDELVEYDLRHVKLTPSITDDALRRLVRHRVRQERSDAADRRLAADAGITYEALRQVRAEQAENEAAARRSRHVAVARALIGSPVAPGRGGPPRGADPESVTVDRIIRKARELGSEAKQPAVAERIGCSDRRIRQVLSEAKPPLTWQDVLRLAAE